MFTQISAHFASPLQWLTINQLSLEVKPYESHSSFIAALKHQTVSPYLRFTA